MIIEKHTVLPLIILVTGLIWFLTPLSGVQAIASSPAAAEQTPVIAQISAGADHTCALTTLGDVQCWGANGRAQLGIDSVTWGHNETKPVAVQGLGNAVRAVVAGGARDQEVSNVSDGGHTCALTTAGGVKCWGFNRSGQLGSGTFGGLTGSGPVNVAGLDSGVQAITLGGSHTCALSNEGDVTCWGDNFYGQLGTGLTGYSENQSTPTAVEGIDGDVKAIVAGWLHTCVLMNTGDVRCWGSNYAGQLGDGTLDNKALPTEVLRLNGEIQTIVAGQAHTCALTTDGSVQCWGSNSQGQLGNGSPDEDSDNGVKTAPVTVVGLSGQVQAITAGGRHTCALTTEGGVQCWGDNFYGQLGNNSQIGGATPVAVTGLDRDIQAITAGLDHTCALTTDGRVKCWGSNINGQLGNGLEVDKSSAEPVAGQLESPESIESGWGHTCALTAAGGVHCWGRNTNGQLGNESITHKHTPVAVAGLDKGVQAISAGNAHTCGLRDTGGVQCWGSNFSGQLGNGRYPPNQRPTEEDKTIPTDVLNLSEGVQAIAAGGAHTCALMDEGSVQCWGANHSGQVGIGFESARSITPRDVTMLNEGVQAITAGSAHTCALTIESSVVCWGDNGSGQIGDGTRGRDATRYSPVAVVGLPEGIQAIGAGQAHTCALTTEGDVLCWGANDYGQLGDGTNTPQMTPVTIEQLTGKVQALAVGDDHTCALMSDNRVLCWGRNNAGQLGNGTETNANTPVEAEGLTQKVVTISAGGHHTCVLTIAGDIQCWGYNQFGQLGDETPWSTTPVDTIGFAAAEPVEYRILMPAVIR